MAPAPLPVAFDVITIGRASVNLYGQQIGARLLDMWSFSKAVGAMADRFASLVRAWQTRTKEPAS